VLLIPRNFARAQLPCHQTGWLSVYLKIYIKALSGASDLDLSVEDDRLLVGDRPRQNCGPDTKVPLTERLAIEIADELSEVNSRRW
jgi:N-terminal acetyltransferase B complex non-catalytic subunit